MSDLRSGHPSICPHRSEIERENFRISYSYKDGSNVRFESILGRYAFIHASVASLLRRNDAITVTLCVACIEKCVQTVKLMFLRD